MNSYRHFPRRSSKNCDLPFANTDRFKENYSIDKEKWKVKNKGRQNETWEKYVGDWMGTSIWIVERTAEYLCRKHWTILKDYELGSVATDHLGRSGDWRTVQHVGVGSQNRQLTTSSTAAHYIDHHPKLASSKLGH